MREERAIQHSCNGCSNKWTGFNRAHCSTCHETFGGVFGFDRHRKYGKCLDPADLGLRLNGGVWMREATFTNDDEETDNQ